MLRILLVTSALLAATSALALSPEREKDYERLAGRAVSVADACLAVGAPVHPEEMVVEIDAALHRFGAGDEEIEEWRSKIVAEKSPDIQSVLRQQAWAARDYYCRLGLSSSREKLKAILSGDVHEASK
jgi:hypothetical protein